MSTTADTTANGTADAGAVDWDSLFATATTENVSKKAPKRSWDGPIPAGLRALVNKANTTGERIVIPLADQAVYDQTHAMIAQVVSEYDKPSADQTRAAYVRPRHDEAGKLTHITFTVGNKRGAKPGDKPAATDKPVDKAADKGNDKSVESESTTVTPLGDNAPTPGPTAAPPVAKPAAATKPAAPKRGNEK